MIKKKAKLRIGFSNISIPELESLLKYNTISGSGYEAKDSALNKYTYYSGGGPIHARVPIHAHP